MTVAYFDHRQKIQTHFKLKPYYFLRMGAQVYILSSLGLKQKDRKFYVNPCYTVRPSL